MDNTVHNIGQEMDPHSLNIGIFVPCCVDQFMVASATHMAQTLAAAGVESHTEAALTCCGQRLYAQGDREGAKQLAARLIEAFRPYTHVVTCSSGCAAYMRHDLCHLFAHSALYHEAQELGRKTFELSHFLLTVVGGLPKPVSFPHAVGLVELGRARRDYPLADAPRRLLQSVEGLRLTDLGTLDTDLLYAAAHPDTALRLWDALIDRSLSAGVQYLVSSEPSLLIQLKGRIAKRGLDIQCRTIADVLV